MVSTSGTKRGSMKYEFLGGNERLRIAVVSGGTCKYGSDRGFG